MNDLTLGCDLSIVIRNPTQQTLLEVFLESSQCPKNTMNFYQLDGYLHALACAPVNLTIQEWQPLIFDDASPEFNDKIQAEQIQCAIVDLYDFHCAQVKKSSCDLPCSNTYVSLQEERADIEQWARGFLQGYIVSESNWGQLLDRLESEQFVCKMDTKTILDDFDASLSIVSAVADAKYAIEEGTDPEELSAIFVRLPESLIRLGQIGCVFDDDRLKF